MACDTASLGEHVDERKSTPNIRIHTNRVISLLAMLGSTSPARQLVFSLLALPPLFLAVYILAGFPYPPSPPAIHPSLASLPPSCPSWSVYPEDYYQGGSYVHLPHGRVRRSSALSAASLSASQTRYWLIGPKQGPRVRALPHPATHTLLIAVPYR